MRRLSYVRTLPLALILLVSVPAPAAVERVDAFIARLDTRVPVTRGSRDR